MLTTAGLDTTVTYSIHTETLGEFDLRLLGGYLHRLTTVATPGAEVVSDQRQQYKPRYVATFDAIWRNGPVTVNYNIDWYDRTKRFSDAIIAGDPDYVAKQFLLVKEKWEHSAPVGLRFQRKGVGLRGREQYLRREAGVWRHLLLFVSGLRHGAVLLRRRKGFVLTLNGLAARARSGRCQTRS